MLSISSGLKKLSAALVGVAQTKPTAINLYEPTPTQEPRPFYIPIKTSDAARFSEVKLRESERLESQSLSMIRGALYAAE